MTFSDQDGWFGYSTGSIPSNVKDTGLMNYAMRRTAGIPWDLRRRMMVLRSLQLMVMNGVVRRAEAGLPPHLADGADRKMDTEASLSAMPPVNDEPAWFTRFFCRRAE